MPIFYLHEPYTGNWIEQFETWYSMNVAHLGTGGEDSEAAASWVQEATYQPVAILPAGSFVSDSTTAVASARPLDTLIGQVDVAAVSATDDAGLDRLADLIAERLIERLNLSPTEGGVSSTGLFARSDVVDGGEAEDLVRAEDVSGAEVPDIGSSSTASFQPPADMGHSTLREPLDTGRDLSHGSYSRDVYTPDLQATGQGSGPLWLGADFIYAPANDQAGDMSREASSETFELVLRSLSEPEMFNDGMVLDTYEFGGFDYNEDGIAYLSAYDDFS